MRNKLAIVLLAGALTSTRPAAADELGNMFSLMFRMMLGMMSAMSDVGTDNTPGPGWGGVYPWSGTGALPLTGAGFSPWYSPVAGNPWNNNWSNPWNHTYPGANNPFIPPAHMTPYGVQPNGYPAGFSNPAVQVPDSALLNGRWYGNTGEILEIRGHQFRLQNRRTAIRGTVHIKNDIVNLLAQPGGSISRYTFARNQSRLILQDAAGQVLVFRQRPPFSGIRIF